MAAYMIFIRNSMHDPAEFKLYSKKAAAARGDHTMKAHVFYGAADALEGAPVDGVVIVEFPDAPAARAWYESAAYQEARAHRLKAADYSVILAEGL